MPKWVEWKGLLKMCCDAGLTFENPEQHSKEKPISKALHFQSIKFRDRLTRKSTETQFFVRLRPKTSVESLSDHENSG
jgi:hypothetical protein